MRYYELHEGQNYEGMFSALVEFKPDYIDAVKATIRRDKGLLKNRRDRMNWYFRWQRLAFLDGYVDLHEEHLSPEEREKLTKLRAKWGKTTGVDDIDEQLKHFTNSHFRTTIQHYLSLPIAEIENYVWDRQSPVELVEDFAAIEKVWEKKNSQYIFYHSENDLPELYIDLDGQGGEGWGWWYLHTSTCSKEANAMGHCGNAGGDGNIVSLRQTEFLPDGKVRQRPSLTFILHDDGYLGEMKGRANEKPSEKYHDAIEALLRHPAVQGIRGGGYKPKNNFDVDDLPHEKKQELIAAKPGMMSLNDLRDLYWELHRAARQNPEDKELVEKLDDVAIRLKEKIIHLLISHGGDTPTIDIKKGTVHYETYETVDSYLQNYHGRLNKALELFEPEYIASVGSAINHVISPLARGLMEHEGLDDDAARKVVGAAQVGLRDYLVDELIPIDVDFYRNVEIELTSDRGVKIMGDLDDLIEDLIEDPDHIAQNGDFVPVMNHSSTTLEEILSGHEPPLIREIARWVDKEKVSEELCSLIMDEFGDAVHGGFPTTDDYQQKDLPL